MTTEIKYNILDQSVCIEGNTDAGAVRDTVRLAKEVDELGYHRFWVTEHHNSNTMVSAAPEIMIPAIASVTKNLRVGSAGVLIPLYSTFKIAEQFNLLENLFPGRIDLGIGRAPGGDLKTTLKVNPNFNQNQNSFEKISELISIFENSNERYELRKPYVAHPRIESEPEIWILGSSPDSAMFAAKAGLRYSFASFINDEFTSQSIQTYYQNFTPSKFLEKPYINLAIFALASESKVKAEKISRCSEMWLVDTFLQRKNIKYPSPESCSNRKYSPEEQMFIEYRRRSVYIGEAKETAERIEALAKKLFVQEITLLTFAHEYEDRLNSYKMFAELLIKKGS